jgi:hypothetical protein
MCNAWNHPPGCACGWGWGYGSEKAFSNNQTTQVKKYNYGYESFTRNAMCPVCGSKVFFYQSSNGGRVFFDELGPPWPKHPCTDNKLFHNLNIRDSLDLLYKSNHPSVMDKMWKNSQWLPLFINEIKFTWFDFLEISGLLESEDAKYFIKINNDKIDRETVEFESIARFRYVTNRILELSLVTTEGMLITRQAYYTLEQCKNNITIIKPAGSYYSKSKKKVLKANKNEKEKRQSKKEKIEMRPKSDAFGNIMKDKLEHLLHKK